MSGLAVWWRSRNLNSNDVDKRVHAVEKLAACRGKEAAPAVIEALSDADPAVRAQAAATAAKHVDARLVFPLVELLFRERESNVVEQIAAALGEFGVRDTVPLLLVGLDDEEVSVRQVAAWALRRLAPHDLENTDRARVAIVQGEWEQAASLGTDAIEPLRMALIEGTQRAKRGAAEALGRIGTRQALAALVSVLRDGQRDSTEREIAAWAVRRFCWEGLEDSDLALAAIVLGEWSVAARVGPGAVEPLIIALGNENAEDRGHATEALGTIATDRAIEALSHALVEDEQDIFVRETIVKALGDIGDHRVTRTLVSALEDDGWPVRIAAASILSDASWRPLDARERASLAIAKEDWDGVVEAGSAAVEPLLGSLRFTAVGWKAAAALVRLGSAGIAALAAVLQNRNQETAVREIVSTALADAGDRCALEPLRRMLRDPDMVIRQSAVWALERLGWEPSTEPERVLVAIVHEDWQQVHQIGAPGVEPLLRLEQASMMPHETASALRHILETAPGKVSITHLREIAELNLGLGGSPSGSFTGTGDTEDARPDEEKIRQLAKFELIRRGIMF